MSQQKQFEGPDIRALLDEIRTAYGQDPTIARAETFRTGGLLGFFQREHYRLVVDGEPEPRTDPEPLTRAQPEPPLRTAVLTQPDTEPEAHAGDPVQRPPGRHYARPAGSAPDVSRTLRAAYGALDDPADTLVADPLISLIEQAEDSVTLGSTGPAAPDRPAPGGSGEPAGTPDGGSFEAILRRVASLVDGPDAVPMVWPSLADLDPDPESDAEPDAVIPDPEQAAVIPDPDPAAEPEPAAVIPDPEPAAVIPDPEPEPAAAVAPAPTAAADPVDTDLRLALHRVGFDPESAARIQAAMADRDLEVAILDFFDSLPPVPRPPDRNGSLIVVVGPPGRAGTEAARLAGDVGADPGGVVAARPGPGPGSSWDRPAIHCVEDAQGIAPGIRRGRVGVVAVEAGPGPADTVWAHRVIHALRPTFVVGVIDAMHKTEDIEAWVDGLGGLDAVIADHPESTVSPARLLDLEVPVARLGSSPATAARWAATILDRVSPDGDAGGWGRP